MNNPLVRPHLSFLPEDAKNELFEARQGSRWLHELDEDLLTPMVRVLLNKTQTDDLFVLEPTLLKNGQVCMPYRWYKRLGDDVVWAKCWAMKPTPSNDSWIVCSSKTYNIPVTEMLSSMPRLAESHVFFGLPSPHNILGELVPLNLHPPSHEHA